MDQHLGTSSGARFDYATTPSSDARSRIEEAHARATLRWDAHAVINDLQRHILIHGESHDTTPLPGHDATLVSASCDAVDGHFYCCREVGKLLGSLNRHAQSLIF